MPNQLLEGIRVVEITGYQTGPLTTQALSNCGAEVIKIDSRTQRRANAFPGDWQKATNKLCVSLNFAFPKGFELAKRLIATTDIFVENLAGGSLIRRGLGYEDIKKIKPDIVYLSTCMQGQTGPYSSHGTTGHKLSALSGFNYIAGWPDRDPAYIAAYSDNIAPVYNVIAIMAALDYRRQTGKGQFLDMSQNETGIQFLAPLMLDYTVNKRIAGREGNKYPYAAPHNAYRCIGDDRWCAIAVFTDREWQNFCKAIGKSALAKNPRFSTLTARKEHEEELDKLVNEWTVQHTAEEVMNLLQAKGVPAGIVGTAKDQEHDPQLIARHFLWELDYQEGGTVLCPPGVHFLLSKTPYELKPAPLMGQHNDYVFKTILGLSDAEINVLVNEKVIN